jgi:hypothetical protein
MTVSEPGFPLGFVELIVGVSHDLSLEIDLTDFGDVPLATFGDIVTAFARATSAMTGSSARTRTSDG